MIAAALKQLTPEILAEHLQVSDTNPMAGLGGRCNLLINLGEAIEKRPDICAGGRPGDMLGMSLPPIFLESRDRLGWRWRQASLGVRVTLTYLPHSAKECPITTACNCILTRRLLFYPPHIHNLATHPPAQPALVHRLLPPPPDLAEPYHPPLAPFLRTRRHLALPFTRTIPPQSLPRRVHLRRCRSRAIP